MRKSFVVAPEEIFDQILELEQTMVQFIETSNNLLTNVVMKHKQRGPLFVQLMQNHYKLIFNKQLDCATWLQYTLDKIIKSDGDKLSKKTGGLLSEYKTEKTMPERLEDVMALFNSKENTSNAMFQPFYQVQNQIDETLSAKELTYKQMIGRLETDFTEKFFMQ